MRWCSFTVLVPAAVLAFPIVLNRGPVCAAEKEFTISGHPIKPDVYRRYVEEKFLPPRPEMSDVELAQRLNLDLPQLVNVKTALKKKNAKALRTALGIYLNSKLKPRTVRPSKKPLSKSDLDNAAVWMADEHEFLGKRYKLGERINWWVTVRPACESFYYEPYYPVWYIWSSPLSRAYTRSGDRKYSDRILTFARSFYENARPPKRDGYCDWHGGSFKAPWHSLSTATRTRYLLSTYGTIGRSPGCTDADRVMFLKMIWEHGDYVKRLLDKHRAHNFETSVTNALMDVAKAFPEFRDGPLWLERTKKSLLLNMRDCILDDGGAFERTTYHFMYLSHYVATYNQLKAIRSDPPEEVMRTLERMHEWVMWVLAPNGDYPVFGHGRLGSQLSALRKGVKLFPDRADFAYVASAGKEGKAPPCVAKVLPHTGFLTMRSDWSPDALYMALNFNGSPKGTDGYEDLPSFGIWSHGVAWMNNAGMTTAGYSHPEVRNFGFRTIGQNTVLVDNTSQDRHDTGGRLESWASLPDSGPGFTYCAAVSDAYRRIGKGVVHRRAVLFIRTRYWLMLDTLTGDGKPHDYEWLGHFQPTKLTIDPKTKVIATAANKGKRLWMLPLGPKSFALEETTGPMATASGDAPQPYYRGRKMAPFIKLKQLGATGPVAYANVFCPADANGKGPAVERLRVTKERRSVPMAEAVGCRVRVGVSDDLLALAVSSAMRQYGEELRTDAEAAYVRRREGKVTEIGLVGGRRLDCEGKRLLEVTADIEAVHVRFVDGNAEVSVHGSGEVSLRADSVAEVHLNGKATEVRRTKGLLRFRTGKAGKLLVGQPTFKNDAASLGKAIGLPPERAPAAHARHGQDSMVVSWMTSFPADAKVECREKGDEVWTRHVNPEPTNRHRFVLSGLEFGKTYDLRITNHGVNGSVGKLETTFTDPAYARAVKMEKVGLVAYYTFDEGKGSVVKDRSGNGNHGKIRGGAKYVRAGKGYALQFDGKDDYVDCGKGKALDLVGAGSVEVWCRVDAPQGGIVNRSSSGGWEDQRLVLAVRANGIMFAALSDGKMYHVDYLGKAEMGSWVHLAMTWDREKMSLYRDGRLLHSREKSVTPNARGIPLKLGWSQGFERSFFKGLIDEVRIYSRTLAPSEVRYHWMLSQKE